jgi:uncharacterized damage-inducible protein DinB
MQKPNSSLYPSFFEKYIALVPEGNYIDALQQNTAYVLEVFNTIPVEKHGYRYAEGKWTIKQVLQHINDTERVMTYRSLVALRGDAEAVLPDMNENLYANNATAELLTMADICNEFETLRKLTSHLYKNVTTEKGLQLANRGTHKASASAYAYMIIGHAIHHINIIKERYLYS